VGRHRFHQTPGWSGYSRSGEKEGGSAPSEKGAALSAGALELTLHEGYMQLRHSNCALVGQAGNLLKALSCKLGLDHEDVVMLESIYLAGLDAEPGEAPRLHEKRGWMDWPTFMDGQSGNLSCRVPPDGCKLKAMSILHHAFDDDGGGPCDGTAGDELIIKIDPELKLDRDLRGVKIADFDQKVVELMDVRREWGRRMGIIFKKPQLGESERIEQVRALNDEYRHELLQEFEDPADVLDVKVVPTHELLIKMSALYVAGYRVSKEKQVAQKRNEGEGRQKRGERPEPQNFGLSFAWSIAGPFLRRIKSANSGRHVPLPVVSAGAGTQDGWLRDALSRDED